MYIEINLLPVGFRPKKRLIKFDAKLIITLVIILAAIGLGGYYFYLKQSLNEVSKQIAFYREAEVKIRDTVALDNEVKELRILIEERVTIIKELTGDSDVRFTMLEHINQVIPENLWLLNITEMIDNNIISYNIEGMSYSKDDISDFLAGLEKFKRFSNVSLESIKPAPLEIRDAYNYVVKVELSTTIPPEEEKAKTPVRATSKR